MRLRRLSALFKLSVAVLGASALRCGSPSLLAASGQAGSATGKSAAARAADETIELGPFPSNKPLKFFESIDATDIRSWRYGGAGNIEVLSRCTDETTKRFVRDLRRRLQTMKAVRPELPFANLDRPVRLFLFTKSGAWEQAENRVVAGGDNVVMLIVNLQNFESSTDAAAKDASMLQATSEAARQFVIAQLLNCRAASLAAEKPFPGWLSIGLQRFYLDLSFEADAVTVAWPPLLSDSGLKEVLDRSPEKKTDLLPMAQLFDVPDEERSGVWSLQLGLFVRWSLVGARQQRRDAFWKFCNRALTRPVTEAVFKECFGITYAVAQAELAGDLAPGRAATEFPAIVRSGFNWPSALGLDDAGNEEVARFQAAVDDVMDRRPRL